STTRAPARTSSSLSTMLRRTRTGRTTRACLCHTSSPLSRSSWRTGKSSHPRSL
ncbi:hypothetical protein NW767_015102, partial [Fusarium falciforme]